jgi:hypothetical protein
MLRLLVLVAALASAGCIRAGEFKCAASDECDRGGRAGVCQVNGFCSFADSTCPSGQRFADLSGDVSNECVGDGGLTIGGDVGGLTGTLVLQNNGGDDLELTMNGPFTFSTPVASGDDYAVSVASQPSGETCTISNDAGTVMDANVTDVLVACVSGSAAIRCAAGVSCTGATEFCCLDRTVGSGTCVLDGGSCATEDVECDSVGDCGGGTAVCCATYNAAGNLLEAVCKVSQAACQPPINGAVEVWCDPADGAAACPGGTACTGTPATLNPGYSSCE